MGVLNAEQVGLTEAIVDLGVVLIVVGVVASRAKPVDALIAGEGAGGVGKQLDELGGDRTDEIAGHTGVANLEPGSGECRTTGAGVGSHIVEGDDGGANRDALAGIGAVGVPELALGIGTNAILVEGTALKGADLSEVAGAHGGGGDARAVGDTIVLARAFEIGKEEGFV